MKKLPLTSEVFRFLSQAIIPHFVNGQTVSGSAGSIPVMDPSTGEPVTQVASASSKDVSAAVVAAHEAFPHWRSLSPDARAVMLHRLSERIDAERENLAQLESIDVGKTYNAAQAFDIPFGAECMRYFADISTLADYDRPLAVKNVEARVHRAPYGVCGFIFPWNFPFTLLCWGIGPALAAGNTVVVKASEVTPLTSLYLAKLIDESGFPKGVINIVTGTGSEAGQALAEHPLVKRISFTGSPHVGKLIGGICGQRLVPCKLELGGKGAAVVLDDVDVEAAATGLAGAITLNTGQVCCTATRWLLHESIYDDFIDRVRSILLETRVGPGMSSDTAMGPLVSEAQLARVTDYYDKGLAAGASAIVPCERPNIEGHPGGYYISPHLLAGNDDNICFREEVFGPTAFLVKFKGDDEAVSRVNQLDYGLANSVWTSDLERAESIAEKMIAGNSWINAHNVFAYGLPYGGVNLSGMGGGVNSPETFHDYLRPQTIARPLA